MNTLRNTPIIAALLAWGLAGPLAPAHATMITIGPTAPVIDGADIANLDLTTVIDDFQTSIIWGDRPARGQTFMTGNNSGGCAGRHYRTSRQHAK